MSWFDHPSGQQAQLVIKGGSNAGTALLELLVSDNIEPGSDASYQLCKTIYEYHPLGAKIVENPITLAQSQERELTVKKGPAERLIDVFKEEWKNINADQCIFQTRSLSRIYGVGSIALLIEGQSSESALDYWKLAGADVAFNCFDPLNTAGSLVLNQNPNSIDFQKVKQISVQGTRYHPSRTRTMMNERPIYIGYTNSSFGYVGRSVYQRVLFPLKSYIQSMITDDMITIKAGVIVAKLKMPGSIVDNAIAWALGQKRNVVREAQVGNVINISIEEEIESLNLQNLDAPYTLARRNILENIASGVPMPAKIINMETFAEGFGEGTEDAKQIAMFVNRERRVMDSLYDFFDKIVMHRAWNQEVYESIQEEFSESYSGVPYEQAFYEWQNSFEAKWPNFIEEPDSEKIKVDEAILKAAIAIVEVLAPQLDPDNKATLIEWACDVFSDREFMFKSPLVLDTEAIAKYVPPEQENLEAETEATKQIPAPPPFSARDSMDEVRGQILRIAGRVSEQA